MINISNNFLKYCLLFLIVINIQLFAAEENTDYDYEDQEGPKEITNNTNGSGCISALPVIKNGKYEHTEIKTYNLHQLVFSCNENFVLEPPFEEALCLNGSWDIPVFPKCLPKCNDNNWNSSRTECVPECGLINLPDNTLTEKKIQMGDFPYHVGIYYKLTTNEKRAFKYVCGGSIISVRLVVTAEYCVSDPIDGGLISLDVNEVFVGAGKFYSDYESPLDINVQKRRVVKLLGLSKYSRDFEGFDQSYNITVLVINKPFIYNNFVQPVCINMIHFNEAQVGLVAGWGDNRNKSSTALNVRLVTSVINGQDYTSKFITSRKYCTSPDQGCEICAGDMGSAWVVPKNTNGVTKYYIENVVSRRSLDGNICGDTMITQHTPATAYYNFLVEAIIKYPNIRRGGTTSALIKTIPDNQLEGKGVSKLLPHTDDIYPVNGTGSTDCKVPFISNGILLISGKRYTSRKSVPTKTRIYIECNEDTYLFPPLAKYIDCQDGKFNTEVPKCSRKCPPLQSTIVKFTCALNLVTTNCTSPSFEGTMVTMLCNVRHLNKFGVDPYAVAVCRDGFWDQPLLTCERECATSPKWSTVYIYENTSNPDDPKGKYICDGSIISENIILTAAECFTNESNGKLLNLESFFLYPEFQGNWTRKILEVRIPPEYKGKLSNFNGNLALVKINQPIRIEGFIDSQCFNEDAKFKTGHRVGSLFFANGTEMPDWKKKFYYIHEASEIECIHNITNVMETSNQFCTSSSVNVTDSANDFIKVCVPSAGSGYFAYENETFLGLQGIASFHKLNNICEGEEGPYPFTALKNYLPFIKSGIEELSLCKIPDIRNCSFTISERNYSINESIPKHSIVKIMCDHNFQIFPPFVELLTCTDGVYHQKLPYCVQCGQLKQINVQDNSPDGVTVAEIPWLVEIYHNMTYKCAGTLINSRIIITNSLCFGDSFGEYQIIVGKQNSNDSNWTQQQNVNNDDLKFFDDIALIILKNPFILNENIQPICLDWKDQFGYQEMTESQPGIVISSTNNDLPEKNINWKIKKLSDIDSSEKILQEYEKPQLPNYFSAKTIEDSNNTCLQDMGSGIAMKNKDGVYFLRGIFTPISNESRTFCTFIKVSYYLPYIIKVVKNI